MLSLILYFNLILRSESQSDGGVIFYSVYSIINLFNLAN